MQLAPGDVKQAYLEIANAALKGTCAPDLWKRDVLFPVETKGTIQIEKNTDQSCLVRRNAKHTAGFSSSGAKQSVDIEFARSDGIEFHQRGRRHGARVFPRARCPGGIGPGRTPKKSFSTRLDLALHVHDPGENRFRHRFLAGGS